MKKLLGGFATMAIAAGIIVGGTGAFFSDTETSRGNTFAAGAFDLLIDNESYYNGNKCENIGTDENAVWKWVGEADYPVPGTPCTTSFGLSNLDDGRLFFDFHDVKPDDEGEDTISIHVENDAWACMSMTLTSNDDVSSTEPELGDNDAQEDELDSWDGELAQNIQMVWWADDGDNVLEDDEPLLTDGVQSLHELAYLNGAWSLTLADSVDNAWGEDSGTPLPGGETVYLAKAWCLGDLTLDPVAAGDGVNPSVASGILCDGESLDNTTQTDETTLDISFIGVQARHNPDFVCEVPDIVQCELTEQFADKVESADQGLRKNGSAVAADRSVTSYALGAPQSAGTPYDNPVIPNSFFSLGFPLQGRTASIVLSFNNSLIYDGPGADLKLWEVTGGTSYPDEKVKVEVANALAGPWAVVAASVTRDAEIDFNGLVATARFVRITDASDLNLFEPTADGFDLDAVQALNCRVPNGNTPVDEID